LNEPEREHDHDASRTMASKVGALVGELERRGVTTDAELTTLLERFLADSGPLNGAKLVARAWVDPVFKALLLADANAAIDAFGMNPSHWAPVKLVAVENTASIHNVIVCTLCSCYPIALLGPAPTWYKGEAYRSRVVREPRAVLAEFGLTLAPGVTLRVWDSTAELRYLVVPQRPRETESLDEEALRQCVSRDALIGVELARLPAT